MSYLNHEYESITTEYIELNMQAAKLNDELEELINAAQELRKHELPEDPQDMVTVFRDSTHGKHSHYFMTVGDTTYECVKVGARCYQIFMGERKDNYVEGLTNWVRGCLPAEHDYEIHQLSGNALVNKYKAFDEPKVAYECHLM